MFLLMFVRLCEEYLYWLILLTLSDFFKLNSGIRLKNPVSVGLYLPLF